MSDLEFIIFIRKSGAYFNSSNGYDNYRKAYITTVAKNEYGHPTQKELNHIIIFLKNSSKENDIILDPFLGSGTTAIACEKMSRKWIGIELSEEYCEIAKNRIDNENRQGKLF